tara:strand:- start:277 stop:543 length:267 start_codon:yes stop_codon:yes gene_type:complete
VHLLLKKLVMIVAKVDIVMHPCHPLSALNVLSDGNRLVLPVQNVNNAQLPSSLILLEALKVVSHAHPDILKRIKDKRLATKRKTIKSF